MEADLLELSVLVVAYIGWAAAVVQAVPDSQVAYLLQVPRAEWEYPVQF
jgi:hypothetical protein